MRIEIETVSNGYLVTVNDAVFACKDTSEIIEILNIIDRNKKKKKDTILKEITKTLGGK